MKSKNEENKGFRVFRIVVSWFLILAGIGSLASDIVPAIILLGLGILFLLKPRIAARAKRSTTTENQGQTWKEHSEEQVKPNDKLNREEAFTGYLKQLGYLNEDTGEVIWLAAALDQAPCFHIDYRDAQGNKSSRDIEIFAVSKNKGAYVYLNCIDSKSDDMRSFRIDRILTMCDANGEVIEVVPFLKSLGVAFDKKMLSKL